MRISDLLANFKLFAVAPEQSESVQDFVGNIQNRPDVGKIDPETEDNADTKTMVAPLQQKLELLKKAVDVDSYYDEEQDTDKKITSPVNITLNIPAGQSETKIDLSINGQDIDELDRIKKIAGIPTASIFDAGDDEPLDS